MFCKKCGKEIDSSAVVCPNCGCATDNYNQNKSTEQDSSSFGYAVLGFLIPLVGLILYLIWKDTTPLRAKSAGKGALVSVIASAVIGVIYGIAVGSMIGSMMY